MIRAELMGGRDTDSGWLRSLRDGMIDIVLRARTFRCGTEFL